jgi:hypothetical protein
VLPETLSVSFVTVIPALKLPTDCGVNWTDTSQLKPGKSDVDEVQGLMSAELAKKLVV